MGKKTLCNTQKQTKMKGYKKILVVGHPRCGTAFMAELLRSYGLDIGHETMGLHGISSWMMAVEDESYPYSKFLKQNFKFDRVFISIRHPLDALQSIVNIENGVGADKSIAFREKHMNIRVEKTYNSAAESFLKWYEIINNAFPEGKKVRIEYPEELDIYMDNCQISAVPPNNVNSGNYDKIPHNEVLSKITDRSLRNQIKLFMRMHGYEAKSC